MEWEDLYQQGDTPWDLGEPAPPLLEILEERPPEIWGDGVVLVPGCGRGHDAAALHAARRRVIGLDLAPSALAEAEKLHGNEDGPAWILGDFFDPALAEEHPMSAIWEHTCFCAIDPGERAAYVESAARWLIPGGRLIALFFLDPPAREEGERGPPFGATISEIRQLFERSFEFVREFRPRRSHPARAGREWLVEMVRNH